MADNGDIVNFTRDWPAPNINDAARGRFRLSQRPLGRRHLHRLSRSSADTGNDWLIYFGRRIETSDGRFLGVIHVGVSSAITARSTPASPR